MTDKNYITVTIPTEIIVENKTDGQCGSCRFKIAEKCLLFDIETPYSEKAGVQKLKQCPFQKG